MARYKVVEVAHRKMFGRRMKPSELEGVLNREAEGDWVLDRVLDADTVDFLMGKRDVFLLIFRSK